MEYVKPEFEYILFDKESDIVTVSNQGPGGSNGGPWGDYT